MDSSSSVYLPSNTIAYGDAYSRSYVCAIWYQNEWNVGKYVNGNCNFSWGGTEWTNTQYKVLVGRNVFWTDWDSSRYPPTNGVYIYSVGSNQSYVCGVYYEGAYHTGKVFNNRCNVGYNGTEYVFDNYQIAFYQ